MIKYSFYASDTDFQKDLYVPHYNLLWDNYPFCLIQYECYMKNYKINAQD